MLKIRCNTNMFLVLDPRMLTNAGGDVLLTKISNPHKSMAVNFGPGMFQQIEDNILLETFQSTVARAVDDGSFRQCGVVLLVNEEVLSSGLYGHQRVTTILLKPSPKTPKGWGGFPRRKRWLRWLSLWIV